MMKDNPTQGANVILQSATGITLQLRDDLHLWGIFGGLMKEGEDPGQAALREIQEELTITLNPAKLTPLHVFHGPRYTSHMHHYPVTSELEGAVLIEGIRYQEWTQSNLSEADVVPWHWTMLSWYWENHG